MRNPWGDAARYAMRYVHNITYSLGAVRAAVPYLASARMSAPARRIRHNFTGRFGMRWEEATPAMIVAPTAGGRAAALVEGQPPGHFVLSYPHPFGAASLREDHDVRHPSIVIGESSR